jgi:hypothetical protein
VTVRFIDPFGEVVRTFQEKVSEPGDLRTTWDGRDDSGVVVPPDAYIYTISATRRSEDVTFDPSKRTGGEPVAAHSKVFDQKSGHIDYVLPKPSRVRFVLSQKGTGWPITTLVDWEPRASGKQRELWDGWDKDRVVDTRGMANIEPVLYAFSLPENVIIVKGDEPQGIHAHEVTKAKVAHRIEGEARSGSKHQHALHPRQRCFDPNIELAFPNAEMVEGVVQLVKPATLRLDVAKKQPSGRLAPIPRATVFIFVDGVLIERNVEGYLPYHWNVDPVKLGPGDHIVTGLLSWRDDHFGVQHVHVKVKRGTPTTQTDSP